MSVIPKRPSPSAEWAEDFSWTDALARVLALPHLLLLPLYALAERLWVPRLAVGAWGERWAARYLRAHGCRILARNCRPTRHLELDLVARQGSVLLFVEVKTRRNEAFGAPLLAIHARKRQRLRRAATHYLAQHGALAARYRFDAVEVIGRPGCGMPQLRWVRRLDFSATRAPDLYC